MLAVVEVEVGDGASAAVHVGLRKVRALAHWLAGAGQGYRRVGLTKLALDRLGPAGEPARLRAQRAVLATGALLFPELGAPVLEPDLNARLAQVQLHGETLALHHIRVVDYLERLLEVVQLAGGERGPTSARLPRPIGEA